MLAKQSSQLALYQTVSLAFSQKMPLARYHYIKNKSKTLTYKYKAFLTVYAKFCHFLQQGNKQQRLILKKGENTLVFR